MTDEHYEPPDEVELPIDGTLDLHAFRPKEISSLVPAYLEECLERGILDVRIVHGKGKGVLQRMVHRMLDAHPAVESYRLGGAGGGEWGATLVRLRPRED